jgi:hypothetical protein
MEEESGSTVGVPATAGLATTVVVGDGDEEDDAGATTPENDRPVTTSTL